MRKKFFHWTPQDIAQWEAIRKKGLLHFVLWYGVVIFGGILFVIIGGVSVFSWVKGLLKNQAANTIPVDSQIVFLGLELAFIAAVCLLGGVVNSLLTWAMEEAVYRKLTRGAK